MATVCAIATHRSLELKYELVKPAFDITEYAEISSQD